MSKLRLFVLIVIFISCSYENDPTPLKINRAKSSPDPVPVATCPLPTAEPSPDNSPTPYPTIVVSPTPLTCPCFLKFNHNGPFNVIPGPEPTVGGRVVWDSTPRFAMYQGDVKGQPCDAYKDNCNGRECSDPRGPEWSVEGPEPLDWNVNTNPYQIKIRKLVPGVYKVTSKARGDLKDDEGYPVLVCPWVDGTWTSEMVVE